jgi:hypothetical protein
MRLTRKANPCDRDLQRPLKSLVRLILWAESWSLPRERVPCWGRKMLSLSLSRPIVLPGCCENRLAIGSRCDLFWADQVDRPFFISNQNDR